MQRILQDWQTQDFGSHVTTDVQGCTNGTPVKCGEVKKNA